MLKNKIQDLKVLLGLFMNYTFFFVLGKAVHFCKQTNVFFFAISCCLIKKKKRFEEKLTRQKKEVTNIAPSPYAVLGIGHALP